MRFSVSDEDGSMHKEAAVKVKWRHQGTSKLDAFIRLETGWAGVPKHYVRLVADDIVKEFCAEVVGIASASFVEHSVKSKHESIVSDRETVLADRFYGRVHHFVYECGDASNSSTEPSEAENEGRD